MKFRPTIVTLISILVALFSSTDFAQVVEHAPSHSTRILPELVEPTNNFPNFVDQRSIKRPKVAVVLSGGGARGIAAVGVLQSLKQHNIPIDLIVGTSMGSIVGGLYAAGYSAEELAQLVDTTVWEDVISYSDESARRDLFLDQKNREERSFIAIRFRGLEPIIPSALSTGQKLTNMLNLLCLQALYHPNPSFDDLEIPYRAVTTDLVSGKQVVLAQGNLSEAMRASMTVPLLFTPVIKDTMELVDGGLIENIPVDVAKKLGADLVIAVDVSSPLRPRALLSQFWEIGDQIMGIMMQASNREQLAKADIVIRPNLEGHLASDFTHLDEVMAEGVTSADSAINDIRTKLAEKWQSELAPDKEFKNARVEGQASVVEQWYGEHPDAGDSLHTISQRELQIFVDRLYGSGSYEDVGAQVMQYPDSTAVLFWATRYSVLRNVSVSGNNLIPSDTILAVFKPLLDKPINGRRSHQALQDVLNLYRKRGYSLAHFRSVKYAANTGVATIDLDEGIIYRMDIHGTQRTRDYVIWRELPFGRDDVFQIDEVAQGMRNLNGTGLFEQVSFNTREEGPHNVVDIDVKERSTELIRLGIRIDNERGIQPSIDVRDDNFLGIGSELGAGYFGGLRNRNYYGEFKATRIFDTYLTFSLRGYYKLYDYYTYSDEPTQSDIRWNRYRSGEYREEHQGVTASFGTQLERLGTLTVEGRVEDQRVWNTVGKPLPGTEDFGISSIKVATKIDTRDQYAYPTDGTLMNLSYESALIKVIQAVGFTKFLFSYDFYETPIRTQTIHPRIIVGIADPTTPITEQFSLGGQNSFFGLQENDSRGCQILMASLEYQWKLPFKLFFDTYLKARYDFGSIWPTPRQISISGLHHGIGLTIGLDTPIGPAEFSIGKSFYPQIDILNKPFSYGPWVTYFSIGYEL